MWLAGIPVADSAILQLGASLREAELIHTAERLEHPTTAKPGSSRSTSQTARRSSVLEDCPEGEVELRATLLQEHVWRQREGL